MSGDHRMRHDGSGPVKVTEDGEEHERMYQVTRPPATSTRQDASAVVDLTSCDN